MDVVALLSSNVNLFMPSPLPIQPHLTSSVYPPADGIWTVMRLLYVLALPSLLMPQSIQLVWAKPFPEHAMVVHPADTQPAPETQFRRRLLVHGLPQGWDAVFKTVVSIQPPLVNRVFTHFFSMAAKLAAEDPVPGRHIQRIPFGSLILEFIANGDQSHLVTKEFVVAASLWLLDAAEKGWTGLFDAWVLDRADGEVVFVRLTNLWDQMLASSYQS